MNKRAKIGIFFLTECGFIIAGLVLIFGIPPLKSWLFTINLNWLGGILDFIDGILLISLAIAIIVYLISFLKDLIRSSFSQ
jgi:hypothetical protein